MRFWKAMLSLCLCVVLFAAIAQSMQVEAASNVTVYLDPQGGSDDADGLTEATAVQSYNTAYDKIKTAGGGTIVFLSTLELTEEKRLPQDVSDVPVVVTSKTGAEGITSNNNVRFMAPTTLENITMTLTKASATCFICGEGNKLVIGENVTSVPTNGYYFCVMGGARWAKCASVDLTVQSGTWRNIYPGTYGYKSGSAIAGVTGDVKFTMTGGAVTGLISPVYGTSATIGGDVEMNLSNMSANNVYGAPLYTATINGDVSLNLGENVDLSGYVFCGGLSAGKVAGTVNITLDGADTTDYTKISGEGGADFTGSVGAANLILKSGILGTSPTGFTSVSVDIPAGKTLTLSSCALAADTVKSAGALVFEGVSCLTASAVTGTVNSSIIGKPIYFHPYVTAPAGSGFVFENNAIPENNGVWRIGSIEDFKGLVLTTTADNISVKLYNGYADNAPEILPVYTDGRDQYYSVEVGGKYKYVAKPASGYSHYNIQKNLYITEEKASTKYVLDVTPPVRTTEGWDPWEVIKCYSDEAMAAAFPSSPDLWPKYAHLFTTPLFNEGRTPHRQTTQTEMMNYIAGLDGADDNMYVYVLGKSGGSKTSEYFDIPVIFYTKTDLSGASTWQEAAELLRANGKLTFMYQAQIHSKEPGNGEAALAMLMDFDGEYGEGLLDNMNLCVIPRFNTWGAYKSKRTVYANGGEMDANRDFMKLESIEVQLRNKLFNAVEPEVYYDAHECNLHPEYEQVSMRDVWISTNFTTKATPEFKDTALTVCYKIFDRAEENNLTYGWYSSSVNGYNPVMSTTNVAMRGSLVFLNESHGIWGGMQQIERRIMSHVTVVTAILDYVNENTAAVQKVVDDQRKDIVERGKTYEENDLIVLKSDYTVPEEYFINGKQVDTGSGEITDYVHTGKVYNIVVRSRTAPTAYVIPAGESWEDTVLEKLDLHGISYYEIPAGSTVLLQQYTGSTTEAALKPEAEVTFEKGAYVCTLAQEDGYILAMLMEPDVDDMGGYEGTFAQQGVITATDGEYPIYRYVHDLNSRNQISLVGVEDILRGDLNDDGTVSDADAMYLLRYTLFGDTRYPLNQGGDMNGDGDISDADAMYLLRYTLFGDSRYPLH